MNGLRLLCNIPFAKKIITKIYCPANDSTNVFGISFKNKVGLAAGFDKYFAFLSNPAARPTLFLKVMPNKFSKSFAGQYILVIIFLINEILQSNRNPFMEK